MNIKYKSSIVAVAMSYLGPVIFLILIGPIYKNLTSSGSPNKIFILILVFFFILTIINSIRMRYIEVSDSGILIKSFKKKKFVDYKDIISVRERNSEGIDMIIKYKDNITGKTHLIKTIPGRGVEDKGISFSFGKTKMFSYMKEQVDKANNPIS